LERLHEAFFAAGDPRAQDARTLLQGMRRHVLQGCTLLFSAVFPHSATPQHDFHWQLAEKVRALCLPQHDGHDQLHQRRLPGELETAVFSWCGACAF
jgi:hypothetical protein